MQPKLKSFNRPFVGKPSPSKYLGSRLEGFSFYDVQHIDLSVDEEGKLVKSSSSTISIKLKEIRENIYSDLVNNLNRYLKGEGIKISYSFEEYIDIQLKTLGIRDHQRLIIKIVHTTPRQSIISTLCRIYNDNTNIHIAIDSYFLGKVRWISVIANSILLLITLFTILVSIPIVLAAIFSLGNSGNSQSNLIFAFILWLSGILTISLPPIGSIIYLYYSWFPVLAAVIDGEGLMKAIKSRFHNNRIDNLFDRDDVLGYLNSLLPFIGERLDTVFKENGFPKENIHEKILLAIKNSKGVTVNNSGFMFGFQIGNNNAQENY